MIEANPYLIEIRRAQLERDAACHTELRDYRPDSGPERAALAGLAIAIFAGTVAIGSFAVVGTLV
jgi:hypothetical protein